MPNYIVNKLVSTKEALQKITQTIDEVLSVDFDLIMDYTEEYGTKWNAVEAKLLNCNALLFKTAWTPPHEVVKKLALLTNAEILHEWASEDEGYEVGSALYKNGTRVLFNDIGGTDAGYQLYKRLFSEIE